MEERCQFVEVWVTHLFLLADPVCPGLSLQVILGVPVRVEDDHGVCRGQVDTQTACTRRQQETEVLQEEEGEEGITLHALHYTFMPRSTATTENRNLTGEGRAECDITLCRHFNL